MPCKLITGHRYRAKPDEIDRLPPFRRTYLAEGDSWMDASAWKQGSLPDYLTRDGNERGRSDLIINISTSGDELTRIVDMMNKDLVWWLRQQRYDGILFSAGGNDFLDAARDPPAGTGLLHDFHDRPPPQQASDCVRTDAIQALVDAYLNPNFEALYRAVRDSDQNAATPIFLNGYDTPTARDAPAVRGLAGPWLYTAYTKHAIPPELWPALTAELFGHVARTVQGWADGRAQVIVVPTVGLLRPADPDSTGDSGDWVNEIHPNPSGWRKQVEAWRACLPS